ncbi:MAG TPA: hypothetical protein VFC93_00540 [Chloroflexota bacterium]|nr:hypothetical protein [Chloroflexota bacterium]
MLAVDVVGAPVHRQQRLSSGDRVVDVVEEADRPVLSGRDGIGDRSARPFRVLDGLLDLPNFVLVALPDEEVVAPAQACLVALARLGREVVHAPPVLRGEDGHLGYADLPQDDVDAIEDFIAWRKARRQDERARGGDAGVG